MMMIMAATPFYSSFFVVIGLSWVFIWSPHVFTAAAATAGESRCTGNISTEELSALQSIYSATHGQYWNLTFCGIPPYADAVHGNPWNFPAALDAPCKDNWAGVNCTNFPVAADDTFTDDVNTPECMVIALNLSYCNLTGYWPNDIANATRLRVLDIRDNGLTGTFPSQIAALSELEYLDASYNDFTATIPDELGMLVRLEYLNLYTNDFTGTIPPSLGNLTALEYLGLGDSFASGTIPESYIKLTKLIFLSISYSVITGTIPTNIYELSALEYFIIAENLVTGAVPEIGSMSSVIGLLINSNYLSVLPTEFAPNLEIVIFYNNFFVGTLPASMYQSRLNELLIYGNHLTGQLPSTFGTAVNLVSMNVMKNRFTGSVPSTLGLLTSLVFSVFTTNYFSGSLPTNLTGLVSLEVLQISNTFITGLVPAGFGEVPNLFELYLTNGYLTGEIPSELGKCGVLNTLELAQNFLTGTLPADAVRNMTSLQSLNFTRNLLHGNTYALFRPDTGSSSEMSAMLNLVSIDLSFNSFTGTLPTTLFTLPYLQTVSMLINCFEGTLSERICDAESLQVLILDGLSSGSGCGVYIPAVLDPLIKGTFFNGYVSGSIPPCIFQLKNLTALHLSGNGLTGTISDIPVDSSLADLAISSNYLTGSIPASIQHSGNFIQLGLGNNRFSGALSNNFSVNPYSSKLDLAVNRLSGPVPITFLHVENIAVLNGNLFGCNIVPRNDPSSSNFVCGSLALNVSITVWVVSWGILMALISGSILIYFRALRSLPTLSRSTASAAEQSIINCEENPMTSRTNTVSSLTPTEVHKAAELDTNADVDPSRLTTEISGPMFSSSLSTLSSSTVVVEVVTKTHIWWATQHLTKRSFATSMLLFILKAAAHVASVLASVYLCFVLTAYIIMKSSMDLEDPENSVSTHTYQYAYISTAAYMHGLAPTLLIIIALLVGSIVITVFFFQVLSKLIQISDYFAAKTKLLAIKSERQQLRSVSQRDMRQCVNGDDVDRDPIDFGCVPLPSVDREGHRSIEISTFKSSVGDILLKDVTGNERGNTDVDNEIRASEAIYRHRSSIFDLFGADRSIHSSRKSSTNTIAAQLRSHWVSGRATSGRCMFLRECFLHIINAAMTIALNAGYVALLLSGSISPQGLTFVQIVLGISKVAWKALLVPTLIANILEGLNRSDQIFHQVFIDVFNFIASPVIATLLTDTSCFLNVFQSMPPVTTQYTVNANFYENCITIVNASTSSVSADCHAIFAPASVTASVSSPWVYSYQCSSSIFVNYVPVLFYTFTFSGVIVPMIQYLLMFAKDATVLYFVRGSYRRIITDSIHWPSFVTASGSCDKAGVLEGLQNQPSYLSGPSSSPIPKLFNVGTLISTIILHFSVLMTFGMVSPVLGLCIAISLITLANQWKLVIGRYLTLCPLDQTQRFKRIEDATSGICAGIFGCLRILVVMVSIFWGVICFDFIADVYGIETGIIGTICILCFVPLPFVLVFYFPQLLVSKFTLTSEWNFSTPTRWSHDNPTEARYGTRTADAENTGGVNGRSLAARSSQRNLTTVNESNATDIFDGRDPSDYLRDSFFLPRWTDDF
jgi:hypothetical protein